MKISTTLLILATCLILSTNAMASDAKEGYTIYNPSRAYGKKIQSIGDINGDGYSDFAISLEKWQEETVLFVIYGNSTQSLNTINITDISEEKGFNITLHDAPWFSWFGAGDFNKDGYSDLILSLEWRNRTTGKYKRKICVIYGGPKMENLHTGNMTEAQGIFISNIFENGPIKTVASIGDVNGDKCDDILIRFDDFKSNQLVDYVVYGCFSWKKLNISKLTKDQGFKIETDELPEECFKHSVKPAGDINNDGYADFFLSLHCISPLNGTLTVILGGKSLDNLHIRDMPKERGFNITYYGSYYLRDASYAGDFNKDGFSDLIMIYDDKPEAVIVLGGKSLESFHVDEALEAKRAIKIETFSGKRDEPQMGRDVYTVGDFNNDGYSDVLLSSAIVHNDENPFRKIWRTTIYIVYGNSSPETIDLKTLSSKEGFIKSYISKGYHTIVPAGDVNKDGFSDFIYTNDSDSRYYFTINLMFGRSSSQKLLAFLPKLLVA